MSRATGGLLFLALAAAVAGAPPIAAQESVFNLPGFGLPVSGESVRARGTGGAGMVLPGEVFSLDSPAPLARFGQAGFYLSLLGQQTRVEDRTTSGEFDDVVFPMGQLAVPALVAVVGVGYSQFVDFDAALESSLSFEGESLPVTLESEGGIGILAPAVAYALDERTSAGISLDFYLGSRETVRAIESADVEGGVITTADTLAEDFDGLGLTIGVERAVGQRIRVGGAYRLRPSVSSEVTAATAADLVGRQREVGLPDEISLGAAAQLSPQLLAVAEFRFSGWEGFEEAAAGGTFGDAFEIGGGLEYAPESPLIYLFGPAAPLRFGARWRRLPIVVDGESVREWTASVGYTRSFGEWSRIDAVFEFGRRGSLDANGLSERLLRFGIGIAAFERWRQRDAG